MQARKLSISLPAQQCEFIDDYQSMHQYKSRSQVIKKALQLLQQLQLEQYYLEANSEVDDAFESTNLDGLEKDNEAW